MTDQAPPRVVVFLGPSMPLEEARSICDAHYLPPAQQGDLVSAVLRYRPAAIGLVDGEFAQALSVWHKEILFALESGIRVYGAASMGAIRAAETERFGMTGIGDIFAMYRDDVLRDDDEVALQYASALEGYRNLSMPLVNIRATLERARRKRRVGRKESDQAIRLAKATFFRDRTLPALRTKMLGFGFANESAVRICRVLENHYVDVKREDTRELLQTLAGTSFDRPMHHDWQLNRSAHFRRILNVDRKVPHGGVNVSFGQIARWSALHDLQFNEHTFNAHNRMLALLLAEILKVKATDADADDEERRFRQRELLVDNKAFESWLLKNDLDGVSFRSLMKEIATCRLLHRWINANDPDASGTRAYLNELRLRGRYPEAADRAASLSELADRVHPEAESDVEDLSFAELVADHLSRNEWALEGDIAVWAEEAGFRNLLSLRKDLERSRTARRRVERLARRVADAGFWTKLEDGEENAEEREEQATLKGGLARRKGGPVAKSENGQDSD